MNSISTLKASHRMFLETLVETRDFDTAVKTAGITKPVANALLQKYSNIYKAVFERLGLTEDDVLLVLKKMVINPEEISFDKFTGAPVVTQDKNLQLKAMQIYFDIVGMTSKQPQVAVQINIKNETVDNDKQIYDKIKASDNYKEIRQTMLNAIDETNKEA